MGQITIIVNESGKRYTCVFDGEGNLKSGDLSKCSAAIGAIASAHGSSHTPSPTASTSGDRRPPPDDSVPEWSGFGAKHKQ